ncbi:unnamed protein product [Fraxinus pennsylvanica]|uniref:Uncharacterized protein n=1 Tax=Fraxinus pennsylvanica TaxID=56036 RepID=A0AAD1Z338_9LAMI|nr:unnamed protein product [Fraxinus pennsylvanica]
MQETQNFWIDLRVGLQMPISMSFRRKRLYMESSLLASTATGRKREIAELIHGRKFAQQLQVLLHKSPETDDIDSSGMTSAQILFRRLILFVWMATGSLKILARVVRLLYKKDRRGCYKRRTSETCTKETSTWIDDVHARKKYGQKSILNSPHPRSRPDLSSRVIVITGIL